MKNKHAKLLTLFSLLACALHALLLQTPFNDYLYTSIFKVIVFLLCPILYFKVSKEGSMKELFSLFSMRGDRKNIRLTLLLGFGVFAAIIVAFVIAEPLLDRATVLDALEEIGITPHNIFFVFLYIVLINAALEQLFFRGFIFLSLYRMGFKSYAHAYSALLFSFYHIPVLWGSLSPGILFLCVLGLIAAGLIFNALALKCKSIGGSLIVHISANLAISLMVGIFFIFGTL